MSQRICVIEECERPLIPPYGRGVCCLHYNRWRRHGDARYVRPKIVGVAACTVPDCTSVIQARGWCAKHWSRWQRYGDPQHRYPWEVRDGKRICPQCNVDVPLREWVKGCCRACSNERMRRHRERNPRQPILDRECVCEYCGIQFMGNRRRWKYCTVECADVNKHRDNWKHLNARRARLREAFVETFDRFEIFERDEWICGICKEPIDPDLKHPHPGSASLDHIIPISRGGLHSRANAQAAHFTCNCHKSASLPK